MHLQRDLNKISLVESAEVIRKLLRVRMFHEQGRDGIFALSGVIAGTNRISLLTNGDVLFTDRNAVELRNGVALFELRDIREVRKGGQGHEQAVALLAAKLQCLDIPLLWIEIATSGVPVLIFSAQKVVLLGELNTKLAVNGEVDTQLVRLRIKPNDYRITETLAAEQAICIGVLTQVFNPGYKSVIHCITSNRLTNS